MEGQHDQAAATPSHDDVASHRATALGVILGWIAVVCLLYSIWPPVVGTPTRLDGVLGVACLLGAVGSVSVGRRLPEWLGSDVPVVLAVGSTAVMAASRPTPQGQLLFGFPMVALAVFVGYFLDRRRAMGYVGVLVVGLVVATSINGDRVGVFYVGVAGVTIALTGMAVAHLRVSRDRAMAALARQALLDPLTGALNRRGLDLEAPVVQAVARRAGRPTSVVVVDLDGFKAYNDEHGHAAGDEALVQFTREWQARLRESDLLARVGGDEFVLVLPSSDLGATTALLRRMRASTAARWSAGTSVWAPGESLAAVLRQADAALYRDKRSRRGPDHVALGPGEVEVGDAQVAARPTPHQTLLPADPAALDLGRP